MCNSIGCYASSLWNTFKSTFADSINNSSAGCRGGSSQIDGDLPDSGIITEIPEAGADGGPDSGDSDVFVPDTTDAGNPRLPDDSAHTQLIQAEGAEGPNCLAETDSWESNTGFNNNVGTRQLCYFMATNSLEMSALPREEGVAHMPEHEECYPGFINVTPAGTFSHCEPDDPSNPDPAQLNYESFMFCPWNEAYQLDLYPGNFDFTCFPSYETTGLDPEYAITFSVHSPTDPIFSIDNRTNRLPYMIRTVCDLPENVIAIPIDPRCNANNSIYLNTIQNVFIDCRGTLESYQFEAPLRAWVDHCPDQEFVPEEGAE